MGKRQQMSDLSNYFKHFFKFYLGPVVNSMPIPFEIT